MAGYCLNPRHPTGRHKARVFGAYGVGASDASGLEVELRRVAAQEEAWPAGRSPYGERYVIDFEWQIRGQTVPLRSAWIVTDDDDRPRLTTCFVR